MLWDGENARKTVLKYSGAIGRNVGLVMVALILLWMYMPINLSTVMCTNEVIVFPHLEPTL